MAHKVLDAVSAVGVSRALRTREISRFVVDTSWNSSMVENTGAEVSAVVVKLQGSETGEDRDNGLVTKTGLAVGSTPENLKTGTFDYLIKNVSYTKTTVAAGAALVTGLDRLSTTIGDYVIALNKFGGFNVYINASGTVKVAFPATAMSYATIALANAAIDAIVITDTTYIKIGKVIIQADGTTWTAGTDSLDSTDTDTLAFIDGTVSFVDLATMTATADEILNKRMNRVVDIQPSKYTRCYLSTLTGTGEVTVRETPVPTVVR